MPKKYGSKYTRARQCSKATFIMSAKKIHGNKYDYSKVKYVNNFTKVIIICKKHGTFEQTPYLHTHSQHGCKKCAVDSRKPSLKSFIARANKIHDNKYDYSKVKYVNANTKVIIICDEHGEFFQRAGRHTNEKQGCPKCGRIRTINKQKLTLTQFIQKSNLVHHNYYNYSLVEYKNMTTKIKIICPKHGIFTQIASNHTSGCGCKKCPKTKSSIIKKNRKLEACSKDTFIAKANKKHNHKYDYSQVKYINSRTKVDIICPVQENNKIHGCFAQKSSVHISGHGCPKCASLIIRNKLKKSNEEFIKQANIVHDNRYDYSKINYINSSTNLDIICKKHGMFSQLPHSHLRSNGCLKCALDNITITNKFISRATKIHKNKYDYSKTKYIGGGSKVTIICKKHADFEQRASHHLSGHGCPSCYSNYSQISLVWLNYLAKRDNIYIQHAENDGEYKIPNSRYRADGFCEETNTIYEFNGCLYHGCRLCFDRAAINPMLGVPNKELLAKTIKKANFIKSAGFNHVCIWEHNLDKFMTDNIIIKKLVKKNDTIEMIIFIVENMEKLLDLPKIKNILLSANINPESLLKHPSKESDVEIKKLSRYLGLNKKIIHKILSFGLNLYINNDPEEIIID